MPKSDPNSSSSSVPAAGSESDKSETNNTSQVDPVLPQDQGSQSTQVPKPVDNQVNMTLVGHIEFCEESTLFSEYVERFEIFLGLNNITDNVMKVSWLCGYGGPVLFNKIKQVCSPESPSTMQYPELKKKLVTLLTPKSAEMYNRYKLGVRCQMENESVSEYFMALRSLSEFCNYGAALDDILRDRFIQGLRDPMARTALINADKMDLNKTVETAQAYEIRNETKTLCESTDINKIGHNHKNKYKKARDGKPSKFNESNKTNHKPCSRCLRKYHKGGPDNCTAKAWKCRNCGKIGHIAPRCRSSQSAGNQVKSINDAAAEFESLKLATITTSGKLNSLAFTKPPHTINILINSIPFVAEIDTGACISVISGEDYHKHFKSLKLQSVADKKFLTADGNKCSVMRTIEITLNNKFLTQVLVIKAQNAFKPLVGFNHPRVEKFL